MRLAPKENFRCPFKYQGQYYDPEIELCYNRFRYYHPETGRYISEDPIGFLSGEPNFFAYVSDTNAWLDLLGLNSKVYGEKDGKAPQIKRLINDKRINPNDDPVILFAPNYKDTPAKDIDKQGAFVIRDSDELIEIIK